MLTLALGFAAVLVSLPLIALEGVPTHVAGYLIGSLVPILVLGFVRRSDLERRQNPRYAPNRLYGPAIGVLAVAAVVVAGLHVWPIATEWAS
jgi:hypothetical protein